MTYRVGKYTLPEYSVLMSVYDRELPENLNESLESYAHAVISSL